MTAMCRRTVGSKASMSDNTVMSVSNRDSCTHDVTFGRDESIAIQLLRVERERVHTHFAM